MKKGRHLALRVSYIQIEIAILAPCWEVVVGPWVVYGNGVVIPRLYEFEIKTSLFLLMFAL
jgi:hypothetical protein